MSDFDVKVKIDVQSLKLVVESMRALPFEVAQRIEKSVMKKALDPVLQDAIRRAPVGDGMYNGRPAKHLADTLRIRIKKVKGNMYGEVVATAPHAHLVELGHNLVRGPRGGPQKWVAWVPPKHFLRSAFLAHEADILRIAEEEIMKALEKRAK